jgi:basic membrane lipoprotein Med (substrate-binding protein (PBP1-ABC) superfamily)
MHNRPLTKLLCAVASAIGLSACLTASAYAPLIDQGVDVVFQHTDSPAPIQATERRGVYAVGYASDMAYFGPKAVLKSE